MSNLNPVMTAALAFIAPPAEPQRIAEYRQALREHDWRHEFAEGDARTRGRAQLERLRELQAELDPGYRIWNALCHPHCTDGRSYPSWA